MAQEHTDVFLPLPHGLKHAENDVVRLVWACRALCDCTQADGVMPVGRRSICGARVAVGNGLIDGG